MNGSPPPAPDPLRVLLVSPLPPTIGGISIWAGNLIEYLTAHAANETLFTYNAVDRYKSVISESRVLRIASGVVNSTRIYLGVRRAIRKNRPHLIHLASSASLALFRDNLLLDLAARSGIPVVTHWHFGRIPDLAARKNWEWKRLAAAAGKSALTVVLDRASRTALEEAGFSNVRLVPNPLGLDFERGMEAAPPAPGARRADRVVFVGHLIRTKGVYELVEACAALPEVGELLLVGPAKERTKAELAAIARSRAGGAWLKFAGPVSRAEVRDRLRESRIVALPSVSEGFPNIVLEAMSAGCAVVATSVGAIPDMLAVGTPSPCGLCVGVGDVAGLKEAVSTLIKDPAQAERLGANGVRRILSEYRLDRVSAQYRALWHEAGRRRLPRIRVLEAGPDGLIGASGYRLFRIQDGRRSSRGRLDDPWNALLSRSRLLGRLFRAEVHAYRTLRSGRGICIARKGIFLEDGSGRRFERVFRVTRGSRPMTLCEDADGTVYFGEYFSNDARDEVRIYASSDGGRSWRVVHRFEQGTIRHVHGLDRDPYTGDLWVTTGDEDGECLIARSRDGFKTLEVVAKGGQDVRTCKLLFLRDHIVFGTDSPYITNSIRSIDRRDLSFRTLQAVEGSVINAAQAGELCMVGTTVEPSRVNRDRHSYLWISRGGRDWRRVAGYRKDRLNMTLFQFGNIRFPRYDVPEPGSLFFSGHALRGIDGHSVELRDVGAALAPAGTEPAP